MVKRRKVSTVEKGSKDTQQNGPSDNGCLDGDKDGGGGTAPKTVPPEIRKKSEGRSGREAGEAPLPVRTSSRVPKRPRRDATPPPSPPKKSSAKGDNKAVVASGTPEAKTRRQWELWSTLDKDLFFEALNEHGKDFDQIQSVIAQRTRKRGNQNLVRTKEQIRHFYYRTWHKCSKFVEVKKDVGKYAMELYALINYGEFRKRVGGLMTEKSGVKLNELINNGVTVVKTKGKNIRVRTPVCLALKKLNNIEEKEQVPIPKELTLELRPVSNGAWATVQAISHNPRLRIHLPSNRRLSAVINFLNKKWKSHRLRLKEMMAAPEELTQELVLTPLTTAQLYPFDVTPISSTPSVNLSHYKQGSKDASKNDSTRSPAAKRVKRNPVCEEHHSEDSAQSVEDVSVAPAVTDGAPATDAATGTAELQPGVSITIRHGLLTSTSTSSTTSATDRQTQPELAATLEKPAQSIEKLDSNMAAPAAAPSQDNPLPNFSAAAGAAASSASSECTSTKATVADDAAGKDDQRQKERVAKLRAGWNLKAAEGVTIAELYLLLGCPGKLVLEYDWVDLVKKDNLMQINLDLTNMLRRLVQLATTEFSDFSKTKPPMIGLESSPQKTCNCGAQTMTPPNRNNKNCRTGGGSTPKAGAKPGAAAVTKASIGTQVPDENDTSPLPGSPVMAAGSGGDGVFRVPNPVPIRPQPPLVKISPNSIAERNLLQQIELHKQKQHHDILMPRRQKKQVMRNLRRPPLVVQRTLLPKTGVPTRQIMTFTVLPNQSPVAQTGSFLPVVPRHPPGVQVSTTTGLAIKIQSAPIASTANGPAVSTQEPTVRMSSLAHLTLSGSTVISKAIGGQQSLLSQAASAAGITPASVAEMTASDMQPDSTSPNLSSILDISLPSTESNDGATNDSLFLSSISNSSFSGLLDSSIPGRVTVDVNEDSMSLPGSASSPNKSFKINNSSLGPDVQWMGGDDFSLSQFLTDSPLKKSSTDPTLVSECSRESIRQDVDTALQSMMNENSMEYSSKFADLAAQIAANAPDIHVSSKFRKS